MAVHAERSVAASEVPVEAVGISGICQKFFSLLGIVLVIGFGFLVVVFLVADVLLYKKMEVKM